MSARPAVASESPRVRVPGAAPQVREWDARGPRGGSRFPSRARAAASCSRAAVNGLQAGEGRGPGSWLPGDPPGSLAGGALRPLPPG